MYNNGEDKKHTQDSKQIERKRERTDQTDRVQLFDLDRENITDAGNIRHTSDDRNRRNKYELSPALRSVPWLVIILSGLGLIVIIFAFIYESRNNREESRPAVVPPPANSAIQAELNNLNWIEQDFLPVNRFSRPGTALDTINGIVIHNIGNPNTTALQNRNYFANVVPREEIFASSHFIICLDGSVIQCVPVDEIAYASNARNADTLLIEVCHPDETGRFNEESYETAIRLTAWLCIRYGLSSEDVIRHFNVERESGPKECPRYFVVNEDAWEQFRVDVQRLIDN